MERLLRQYEQEFAQLMQAARRYGERFPAGAAALELHPNGSDDPEIERLLQSVALLQAQSALMLEDCRLSHAASMLQMLYPHYLRPIPSMSIVQFDTSASRPNEISAVTRIARGTLLRQGRCKFTTSFDVEVSPLKIAKAALAPTIDVPATLKVPVNAASAITVTIKSTSDSATFDKPSQQRMRVFIDAPDELRAALMDALFMQQLCTCLEAGQSWHVLPTNPFLPVGYEEEESLLPLDEGDQSRRLLTEYFAFPEKFAFMDVDLNVLSGRCPPKCSEITFHIALPTMATDRLRSLSANHLRLSCTPVINLFKQSITQVRLDGRRDAYPVKPDHTGIQIYSIDKVTQSRNGELPAFHTPGQREQRVFWRAETEEGNAVRLVGRDQTAQAVSSGTLSIDVSCTNGVDAGQLLHGDPRGDLMTEAGKGAFPIRMLCKPTQPVDTLIAGERLTKLAEDHGASLSAWLALHAPQGKQAYVLSAIKDVVHQADKAWVSTAEGLVHMRGTTIRVAIDTQAFDANSIFAFALILNRHFQSQAPASAYVQLCIANGLGEEILRLAPYSGRCPLL